MCVNIKKPRSPFNFEIGDKGSVYSVTADKI